MSSQIRFVFIMVIVILIAPVVWPASDDESAKPTTDKGVPIEDIPAKPTTAQDIPEGDIPSKKPVTELSQGEENLQVSSWSGMVDSLWTKVRSVMISEDESESGDVRYSTTAGIRGAKSKDDLLKPIWKGKRKQGYLPADLRLYNQAKADFEKKDYNSATTRLNEFHKVYKYSQLKPQAQILLALCYVKTNKQDEAIKTLDEFLKQYPKHQLTQDVKELKAKMAKKESK
jgi:TolA-binding protein